MQKPVILIGGANGTGKTSLARRLVSGRGMDHMIGTGFLREIVRSTTDRERDPILFEYSFGGPEPFRTLVAQAERLRPAVLSCLARARREGTSLVVEGTHLLPDLYADIAEVSSFVVLGAPIDSTVHDEWLLGTSHTFREMPESDRLAVRSIDRLLIAQADRHLVPVLRGQEDLDRFCEDTWQRV
jgi:2-phosphoglycerate kinase